MNKFRKLTPIFLGVFLMALPLAALAGGKQLSQSIYIGPEEIVDGNLIKAGNVIEIHGPVNGDVIVAGSAITITGPVAGDVIAAGSAIKITGDVSGSIRVVGGSIEISGKVERNVWAAGGSVAINSESNVGWDVYSAGGNVDIKAPVGGNVWAAGAGIVIGNTVGKSVSAVVDEDGQLIFNPEAVVAGDVKYKALSEEQLIIREGAEVKGEISKMDFTPSPNFDADQVFGPAFFFFKVISLFSLLIIGIVLISLVPKILLDIKNQMIDKPWPSIGWGLVYLVAVPAAIIILAVTIIGIPLALMLIPLYFIGLYAAKVVAAFAIGTMIFDRTSKEKYKGSLIWPLLVGLVVFVILTSLPLFGWLIKCVLVLWALGAIIKIKKQLLQDYK